jgi:tetratricopeptide (TPR) repeat protein
VPGRDWLSTTDNEYHRSSLFPVAAGIFWYEYTQYVHNFRNCRYTYDQKTSGLAEYQKDWDTMELRSQRATVVEEGNTTYLLLFSRALQRQKKNMQAEQAASAAISSSTDPNPWLYNHRAWLRWSRNDYDGAQQDWQRAIEISPTTAGFYYSMGLVYEKGGNINEAATYFKKALDLKPDDQKSQIKLNNLKIVQ